MGSVHASLDLLAAAGQVAESPQGRVLSAEADKLRLQALGQGAVRADVPSAW